MTNTDKMVRTGLGVLIESAPAPPDLEELKGEASHQPKRSALYGLAAAGLSLVAIVAFALLSGRMQLAYATEPGLDLGYVVDSVTTVDSEAFRHGGNIRYRTTDAGEGLIAVEISYEPPRDCDPPHESQSALFECLAVATFAQVVAEDGTIVSIEMSEVTEIPEFVIPTPIPHAGVSGGFPNHLGPPFPDRPLRVGDHWETDQNGVAGRHHLVAEEELDGREVVVVESSYSFEGPESRELPVTATATVWFDPAEGIVVKAHMVRYGPKPTKHVETTFELVD